MMNRSFRAQGAIVLWSAGPTHRELLTTRLEALGYDKRVWPREKTDRAALKTACQQVAFENRDRRRRRTYENLVVGLSDERNNGFELARVFKGDTQNVYAQAATARVEAGLVRVAGSANQQQLQELYDAAKATLSGVAVGQVLVRTLGLLGAVALRESGGVYWLPEGDVARFAEVANAVERSAVSGHENKVYICRTMLDEDTVRCVRDHFTDEVMATCNELAEELANGDMGGRALQTRKARADELSARVARYERELGESLEELKRITAAVQQHAAVATLQALGAAE